MNVPGPLRDQGPLLAAGSTTVFVLDAWHCDHGTDPRLTPLVGEWRADQRPAVELVGLGRLRREAAIEAASTT
jgi:hypothetical protein